MLVQFVLVTVTLVLCGLRFSMPTHPVSGPGTYEAIAHLFVGGLLGAWISARPAFRKVWSRDKFYLSFAVIMIAVEVTCFIMGSLR